ncbi:GntR family transcriptional regulator [Hoeflea sp. TYP-13]|uniref:GntR family transcriptional regulator n=1 Tax=Hoeflea sp. TYP-13 TaxID=3230023 RepID=UPI0034C5EA94
MSNLSERISETLKQAILAQRLYPGTKLGERELAEIFDVSRIVIRQALIRLANEGLVTIERNRGAFVTRPSLQEALEIYDTLTLLEQGVAMQLAERLDASGWQKLRDHIALQAEAVERNDHKAADELGQGFHTLFISLAGNRLLQDMHAQIVQRTFLLRSLYTSRFDYCNLLNEHTKIVNLLERGRVKQAMELIDAHHRHVVRGYVLDTSSYTQMSLKEAIKPDLEQEDTAPAAAAAET